MAGVTAGVLAPAPLPAVLLAAAWGGALSAFLAGRPRACTLCLLLAFGAAGWRLAAAASAEALHTPLRQAFDRARVRDGGLEQPAIVVARLRRDATLRPWGATLDLEIERVRLNHEDLAAPGGMRASVAGTLVPARASGWRAGRRLRLPVQLRPPARYLNPGMADQARLLAWRGTALVGTVKSAALVEVLGEGTWIEERAAGFRHWARRSLDRAVGRWDARSAAIVTAILIGDRAGLDPSLERRLQEAGTYHVIAISGGNIAILTVVALWTLRRLGLRDRAATGLTMAVLGAYGWLVGPQSSVSRATLMAVACLGARLLDHRTDPLNALAVAVAAILAATPLAIADAGLELTCGATLAIVVGAGRACPWLRRRGWLAAPAALGMASLSAELALFPLSALLFSRVTVAGLFLNFLAVPVMAVGQVAGMTTLALSVVGPRLAAAAGWLAHLSAWSLAESAAWVEYVPWLSRRVPPPAPLVLVAYYAAVGGCLLLSGEWAGTRWSQGGAVWWRRAMAAAAVAAALWIVADPASEAALALGRPRTLRATFLDVGQGDATLIQLPGGRSLLVDAGGGSDTFDLGARVVAPALWQSGVRRLDALVITHGDPDHIGGAPAVLRDFVPREIWDGVLVPPHEPMRMLREQALARRVVWRTVRDGDRVRIGEVEVRVWHPAPPDWERQEVRNDDSVVLEIRYGCVSIVLPGDIGRATELALAPHFAPAGLRILKAAHHGSGTSSAAGFLRALRPDLVVFSSGRDNPYGHPVPAVVRRVRQEGAAIVRTDRDGAVSLETDGVRARVGTYAGSRTAWRAACPR